MWRSIACRSWGPTTSILCAKACGRSNLGTGHPRAGPRRRRKRIRSPHPAPVRLRTRSVRVCQRRVQGRRSGQPVHGHQCLRQHPREPRPQIGAQGSGTVLRLRTGSGDMDSLSAGTKHWPTPTLHHTGHAQPGVCPLPIPQGGRRAAARGSQSGIICPSACTQTVPVQETAVGCR